MLPSSPPLHGPPWRVGASALSVSQGRKALLLKHQRKTVKTTFSLKKKKKSPRKTCGTIRKNGVKIPCWYRLKLGAAILKSFPMHFFFQKHRKFISITF